MSKRRLPLGILVPAALVVLVGTLATLQYRWLGQVGEAERQEMRASLTRRATDFAEEFDREITRTYNTFRAVDAAITPATPEGLATAYEAWLASAPFPALVKAVYFARDDEGTWTLLEYRPDSRQLVAVDWPASLEPVRIRLMPATVAKMPGTPGEALRRGTELLAFTMTPVVSDVPALLISMTPVVSRSAAPPSLGHTPGIVVTTTMASIGMLRNHLVVEFDRGVIADQILPALADRHFATDRYRVAVVDGQSAAVLTRGLQSGATIDPEKADVSASLLSIRTNLDAGSMSMSRTPAPAVGGVMGRIGAGDRFSFVIDQRTTVATRAATGIRMPAPWQVRLQHAAGSLDVAVTQARRRNLWLSFGILSVLMASVGLILFNARRSERLAAQQMDFVATVSHELRTPLAVIRSAAQNLAAGVVPEPAQARQYGELIESEGRRLTDMVEQVLQYAGLSDARRPIAARPVDAVELVRDVLAASAPVFDAEQFKVAVEIHGHVPLVLADEDALRRAIANLVSNALKYGSDGRWLGVTVEAATLRRQPQVQISVSDRGRGIDPADLPHVFESFYRGRHAVERQIHGNGLGLSLVKRIADAHGGRVSVKSTPGQGATFTMQLPAIAGDPAADVVPAPATGGGRPT